MGACGSRGAIKKSPVRDLSNWEVDENDRAEEHTDGSKHGESPTQSSEKKHNLYSDSYHSSSSAPGDVQLQVLDGRADFALNCVAYHPSFADTQTCLTGWEDGSIWKLHWNAGSDQREPNSWKPHDRAVNQVIIGKSAELIYSCSRDTTIALTPHLADTNSSSPSEKKPNSVLLRGHNLNVATIAVDDAELSLCSGGRDTQTIFWDLQTGRLKAKNITSQNVVTCSKWIPSEPLVVQGSEDLTLKIWDERTALKAPVQSFRGYVYFALSIDVSTDSNYILTSSKGFNGVGCEVRVWDRRAAKQLHEFTGHQQDTTSCCFLPPAAAGDASDSSSAIPIPVTASKDGTVKVWDAATSSALCEALEPSAGMFTSICAVNSSTLLASTFSGSVHTFAFNAGESTLRRVA